jgi:hypothetical protein
MLSPSRRERVLIYTTARTTSIAGLSDPDWILHSVQFGSLVPVSIVDRAQLDQIGHSDVQYKLVLFGNVVLMVDTTKFAVRGRTLFPVAFAAYDLRNRTTTIYVREEVSGSQA